MKKFGLLSLLLVFIVSGCSFSSTNNCEEYVLTETNPNIDSFYGEEEKDIIVCDLNYGFSAIAKKDYSDDTTKIEFSGPSHANANMQIVITGLLGDNPKLKGNAGETDLVKIDNGDTIYLLETTGFGNLVVWTYYPEQQTLSMTKQYGGMFVYSSLAMGFCK